MSKKPRGLGAGFASLLGSTNTALTDIGPQDELTQLSVSALVSGRFQPRSQWDELALSELADSIRSQGVIQPIVVRSIGVGQYEIIAGERRWRAAKLAGLINVPAVVRELNDQSALAIALIENIQRENLTAIEEARAMRQLADTFALTHEQIAQTLGRSREAVSNLLRLLKLELSVQEAVLDGQLSAGHARCLVALSESEQQRLAQQAMSLQWSVRDLEQVVRQLAQPKTEAEVALSKPSTPEISQWQNWQKQLSQLLGMPVKLSIKAGGKGKLEINFSDEQFLKELIEKISS
jgi:ParB family transcriptional regulator, chromosome partitioning protein